MSVGSILARSGGTPALEVNSLSSDPAAGTVPFGAKATVRSEVGACGAGERSGTVEGDLVPSAVVAEGAAFASRNLRAEVGTAVGVSGVGAVAEGVREDLMIRLVGVYGFSACRFASRSLSCCATSSPVSWLAMLDGEVV